MKKYVSQFNHIKKLIICNECSIPTTEVKKYHSIFKRSHSKSHIDNNLTLNNSVQRTIDIKKLLISFNLYN